MSWTPALKKQYQTIREELVANFNNNMNVIQSRSIPAALDYPNASNEVNNSKATVLNITQRMAQESDSLGIFLKSLNEKHGKELATEVSETEMKLRSLEKENQKYAQDAEVKKEQVSAVYNKYEGNYHSQNFTYAPWEINSSRWFSYSPIVSYNLNPTARSGLLLAAFMLGFAAILVLGARAALAYYYSGSRFSFSFPSLNTGAAQPIGAVPRQVKQGLVRKWAS